MANRLFLLDGMALLYRAHFAFAHRPIRTAAGLNTSALFGFVNTLLDIIQQGDPSHLAVAYDTEAPTSRHLAFPDYKAQREAMPEDLAAALPLSRRLLHALRIPILSLDGFEADDLIGTLARRAEPAGFETFMVTPDKDFGQLVTERTRLWKPGRQGGEVEILGPAEVCNRWGIRRVEQVIDMLGLMGDASDNIPGVRGVGEKTAAKLLAEHDTLEGVLAHADAIKGKLGESLRDQRDIALLSKQLATIIIDAPIPADWDALARAPIDEAALRPLLVELEFNSLGRRLLGDDFKAGRGFKTEATPLAPTSSATASQTGDLFGGSSPSPAPASSRKRATKGAASRAPETGTEPTAPADLALSGPPLKSIRDIPHTYRLAQTPAERADLARDLARQEAFCFDTETVGLDPQSARLVGVAFSFENGTGWYVPVALSGPASPRSRPDSPPPELAEFLTVLADPRLLKIGHNLKFDLLVLRWHGVRVVGPFFDTMIAHALVEPELRHGMDYVAESLLGYTPIPITDLIGPKGPEQKVMSDVPVEQVAEYAAEDADVTWQLRGKLLPRLGETGQERVFFEVEMPVLPALVAMEFEGVQLDAAAMAEFSGSLAREMAKAEAEIQRLAGRPFNVNSNKQLGEILFDELRLVEKPKRTPTGQYATDEQTLLGLATDHPIVRRLLDYRTVAKLKSTYADALPAAISPGTGRIHTTYHQAATATGRLSSVDPNLQNIPIRTDRGQEIRRAFVAREGTVLLSADYSQIELRIIAALSREEAMIEAFRRSEDIHRATAARVFNVAPEAVTPEMRRRAKMVNFGIAYGISAFGLAQRLAIPRSEASQIIDHYFASYPGIRRYMDETIATAREKGYVETLIGRRRHLRDIRSANATVRGAAERNAINTPIQGTAADMIKLAMARIHREIERRHLGTRLLLQVHDELVFELLPAESGIVKPLVEEAMRTALPLPGDVPIVVEMGTGAHWLEAH